MNEELIRRCAREAANGPHGYAHEIAERSIRLYHARAVAPLERENEALKLLLNATEGMATDHAQEIMELRAKVAPLVEAAREKLHQRLADIGGCLDGNCMVVRPKGVHTNGGCQCLKNWTKTQQVVNAYKAFEAEVSTLKRHEPSEGERVEKVAAAIERELMVIESLLADPATLRKIKSQRIARAALKAMEGE